MALIKTSPMFDSIEIVKTAAPAANCPHGYQDAKRCGRCTPSLIEPMPYTKPQRFILRSGGGTELTCDCCRILLWEPLDRKSVV